MNKIVKYLIVLVTLLLLFGCKKSNNNNDKPNNIEPEKVYFKEIDLTNNFKNFETFITEENGTKIEINFSEGPTQIFINNGQVFETPPFNILSPKFYLFDKNFVFATSSGFSSNIYIYNSDLQNVVTFSSTDDNNMVINTYEISKDGIIVNASNLTSEGQAFSEDGIIDNCDLYNKYKDSVYKGKYKIKYNTETQKFENMDALEIIKLKDLKDYSNPCK